MKPFISWYQKNLKFDLYDAGGILFYCDNDLIWKEEESLSKLSFIYDLLGDEAEAFKNRFEYEISSYQFGNQDLKRLVSKYLDPGQCAKYVPKLERISDEYEYSGDFRFAPCDNEDAMKEYARCRSKGCCGFFDEEIEIEGQKYMFGFNYGH